MPTKSHRSTTALARTHSRTASGGSTRAPNLQLTQKDPNPPKYADKGKKTGHIFHETNGRNTSPVPRTNSSVRVQSRERIQQQSALRRGAAPSNGHKSAESKQKVGFTIASPVEGENDDDEWVSSESGAATPCQDSDIEEVTTPIIEKPQSTDTQLKSHVNGFAKDEMPTPRAETPELPRVDTIRPTQSTLSPPVARDYAPHSQEPLPSHHSQEESPAQQQSEPQPQQVSVPKARSETHSPPRRSPDPAMRRQAMTRPPSTHSIASKSDIVPLRPHPLIRAHSYGYGALGPAKRAPLAPLTTVEDSVPVQIATSPSSYRAVSPTMSIKTASASPVLSHASPASTTDAHSQLRRTSTSSTRSVATMPAASSASHAHLSRNNHDRQRTMSSSSTFAALSSLAMRGTPSPPRTPLQQLTVFFPPAAHEQNSQLDSVHPLLPPPYLSAHLTMLAYRNPMAESYERITKAKAAM